MAKPAALPIWATNVGALNVDPGLAKKQEGWEVNEFVPPHWLNWWMNLTYQWTQYVDALHNETQFLNKAYTWTGVHTFAPVSAAWSVAATGAGGTFSISSANDTGLVQSSLALTLQSTTNIVDINAVLGFDLDISGLGDIAMTAVNGKFDLDVSAAIELTSSAGGLDVDVVGGFSLVSTGAGDSDINAGTNRLTLTADEFAQAGAAEWQEDIKLLNTRKIAYSAVATRTIDVNIANGNGDGGWVLANSGGAANVHPVAWQTINPSNEQLWIPLQLQVGWVLKNFEALLYNSNEFTGSLSCTLVRWKPNFAGAPAAAVPNATLISYLEEDFFSSTGSQNFQIATRSSDFTYTVADRNELWAALIRANGVSNTFRLYGLRLKIEIDRVDPHFIG